MRKTKFHGCGRLQAIFIVVFLFTGLFFIVYTTWPHNTSLSAVNDEKLSHQHHKPSSSSATCPDYFRWIYEDLRPWKETGINREMVMRGNETAHFHLIISKGKVYMKRFYQSYQTRDIFTVWGILQLLARYPGKIPDLELMFDCEDLPAIEKERYFKGKNVIIAPPPLFAYCADDSTLDIPFPDWSFWGWLELRIKPWEILSKELQQGNKRIKWVDREPFAYWKGNPSTSRSRLRLVYQCNVSEYYDWGIRVYAQNWTKEEQQDFKESNLANQCTHRYKIYVEGRSWSVSEKYILACDSLTLLVQIEYYDFFSRGLIPMKHYWPLTYDELCGSIKHAVEWGNKHPRQAHSIGRQGSKFVHEELKMDHVYDYMLHLLTQYANLLTYTPGAPGDGFELVTSEGMLAVARERDMLLYEYLAQSQVGGPAGTGPCDMPAYSAEAIESFQRKKRDSIEKVEAWRRVYFNSSDFINLEYVV